jgi:hypothetical protein
MQSSVDRYKSEIDRLHIAASYRPMKNSFVLGLETMCGLPLAVQKGQRKTILEATGCGSVRHIWETHGPGPAPFELEFFIDGEKTPSLKGKLAELIDAAEQCEQDFVINPGGVIANDSYNLYLPIPFEKSVRVDLVSVEQMGMIFMQIDYRLEDDSTKGVHLTQAGQGKQMRLAYQGAKSKPLGNIPAAPLRKERFRFTGSGKAMVKGPAIIRRLAVEPNHPARLKLRFDDETSSAVDVDLQDFFGAFNGPVLNHRQSFFPMPFAKHAQIEIDSPDPNTPWSIEVDVEETAAFLPNWEYFHAKSSRMDKTSGYEPFTVLHTRGGGRWLGMSLYRTGHDHGGGDFAVIDEATAMPAFLHGINGEDYFSFAFFGKGENFPYSEAFDNDTGRIRLHLENPYPFKESIYIGWGQLKGQSPRGVAFWYQNSPADLTLSSEQTQGRQWLVFGPVTAKDANNSGCLAPNEYFAALPSEQMLDAGQDVQAEHLMFSEKFNGTFKGWAKQYAIGNHLNLMYIYGHVMDLGGHHHMGYYPRAMMAKTTIQSDKPKTSAFQLSYDDPLRVCLNGKVVYEDMRMAEGFKTRCFSADLKSGQNSLLIKLLDTPNNNTCWAGFSLNIQ